MAEITREQVVDFLSNLPVIQIAELIRELEGKLTSCESKISGGRP